MDFLHSDIIIKEVVTQRQRSRQCLPLRHCRYHQKHEFVHCKPLQTLQSWAIGEKYLNVTTMIQLTMHGLTLKHSLFNLTKSQTANNIFRNVSRSIFIN